MGWLEGVRLIFRTRLSEVKGSSQPSHFTVRGPLTYLKFFFKVQFLRGWGWIEGVGMGFQNGTKGSLQLSHFTGARLGLFH